MGDTDQQAAAWDAVIVNTRLLDDDSPTDIAIRDGRIARIAPDLEGPRIRTIDAGGGLTTPSFTDPHFHLDKVLSRGHFGALNFKQAFDHARDVKCHFTVADVEQRACTALELAVGHGLGRMRAQVDVDFATGTVSMEGVLRAKERYRNQIDIQVVAFPQEGIVSDPEATRHLRETIRMGAKVIGGLPEFEANEADQKTHVETIFDLAEEFDLLIDMHADYTDREQFKTLEMIADMTIARGMQGRVNVGHCCALAVYGSNYAKKVIDRVAEAGMQVSVLPIANLQMLGGEERTPMNRGSSRILELLDAGVNVAAGADNMFDIWYRFNRMDPVDVGLMACLSGGMRTDEEVREAFNMITTRANRYIGLEDDGAVREGGPADLVVHSATTLVDIFRNLPERRLHLKNGALVGGREGSVWAATS